MDSPERIRSGDPRASKPVARELRSAITISFDPPASIGWLTTAQSRKTKFRARAVGKRRGLGKDKLVLLECEIKHSASFKLRANFKMQVCPMVNVTLVQGAH